MNSFKNILIVTLCLTTVGSSYYAWTLSQKLSAPPSASHQSASFKAGPAQTGRFAATDVPASVAPEHDDEAVHEESAAPDQSRRAMSAARREAVREVVESPEFQSLQSFVRKGTLDRRYAALFKQLNLTPEELDVFKQLLVERQNTQSDVFAAARKEGLDFRNNREELTKLMESSRSEIDETIRNKLGEQVYDAYTKYNATMPYRAVVDNLGQKLSYTPNPLTDAQENQLIDLIARTQGNANPNSPGGTRGVMAAFRFDGGGTTPATPMLTQSVLDQARGILTPDQFTALSLLQQEQQAGAKMGNMIRSRIQENISNPQ